MKPDFKSPNRYWLAAVPVIYFLTGIIFRQIFGDLSLRSNDPDYIQFLSGMCISTGRFDQANIDHPGSTMQFMLAIIFRIIYSFRGSNIPFFEDAMLNSDFYLAVANLMATTIVTLVLYWAGCETYKLTGNVFFGIIFQSAPLINNIWYEIIGRIYPELFFIIPVTVLGVQFLRELYRNPDEKQSIRDILIYSFTIAFGMASKMTFLPFIAIPLIMIRTFRHKFMFLGISSVMFLLFALPVTLNLKVFWSWMKGLFIHSGAYRSGEKNIVNIDLFLDNLDSLLKSERHAFYVLAALILVFVMYLIFKKEKSYQKNVYIRFVSGALIAIAFTIFIVSKQYGLRYFIPVMLLYPFLTIIIIDLVKILIQKNIAVYIFALLMYKFTISIGYAKVVARSVEGQMAARNLSRDIYNSLPSDKYMLFTSQDYGSPLKEYAIMYSFSVAGHKWVESREILNKLYPKRYMYFTWGDHVKLWGQDFNPDEAFASGKPVFLYLEKNTEELYNRTIKKFFENYPQYRVDKRLIFQNAVNNEAFLELTLSKIEQTQ